MRGNIETFTAPNEPLRPDEKGFAAFETAGRRIGPLYNQAGQDYREIGRLQAQAIQDRKWPLDILALQQKSQGGFKVEGLNGGGGSHRATDHMAAGMSALGGYLGSTGADWGTGLNPGGGKMIDLTNGTTSIGRNVYQGTGGGPGFYTPDNTAGLGAGGYSDDTPLPDNNQAAFGRMIDSTIAAAPNANPSDSSGGWFSEMWNSLTGGGSTGDQ